MVQALRKPANLPYPRLPAPIGPNFKENSPPFLKYKIGSKLVYKQLNTIPINAERPHKIHFKVIGLLCSQLTQAVELGLDLTQSVHIYIRLTPF